MSAEAISTKAEPGTVYLVGAGPGSVDLLTLRAHAMLTSATCILHDDLVSAEVLALAPPRAFVNNVGKRCGRKTITQEQINGWMIQYALERHSVVRLKSGDPLLFGRAAEEIDALSAAAIPFEIIPGISAGFAAAALAGVPLTGRISTSRVVFATRHLSQGATDSLTGVGPDATLVLYMPGKNYRDIATELSSNGWPATTQCLITSSVGTGSQLLKSCLLSELAELYPLPSPALMIFFGTERKR